MNKTIAYICHPVGGNVEANLAEVRRIIQLILTDPQYSNVIPYCPWYPLVVAGNDADPVQRQKGLDIDVEIIRRMPFDELWELGNRISEGMKLEIFAAWKAGRTVRVRTKALEAAVQALAAQYYEQTETERKTLN